jgi:hypothetical protein
VRVIASAALAVKQAKEVSSGRLHIDRTVYTRPFAYVLVPRLQCVVESLQYASRMCVGLNGLSLDVAVGDDGALSAHLDLETVWAVADAGFDPGERPPLCEVGPIVCLYAATSASHSLAADVDKMAVRARPSDIACLKQFAKELAPVSEARDEHDDPAEEPSRPLAIDARIKALAVDVRVGDDAVASISAFDVNGGVRTRPEGRAETTITVGVFRVTNVRGEKPVECVELWTGQPNVQPGDPFLRIQAKQGTPVGGISVFNQIEINLQPTIVNYDASFFNFLIDFVLAQDVAAPRFEQAQAGLPMLEYAFPEVLVPLGLLPKIEDALRQVLANQSGEYAIKADRAEENFLLRYFKITATRLCVSYFNPENKIVPQITNFAGLLHDVILQDFTASMATFIWELVSQISSDMIPQFIKHLFGLGKGPNKPDLPDLARSDHDLGVQKKKELLFGKMPKK